MSFSANKILLSPSGEDDVAELTRDVIAMGGSPLPDDLRPHRVLSPDLAALFLGVSTHALRWQRRHGAGPVYVRMARNKVGYLVPDLQHYIEARRVAAKRG